MGVLLQGLLAFCLSLSLLSCWLVIKETNLITVGPLPLLIFIIGELRTPPFSVINLLETVFSTHKPNWNDFKELLQVLFSTEEGEKIQAVARKLVPGSMEEPTNNKAVMEAGFLLPTQIGTLILLKVKRDS